MNVSFREGSFKYPSLPKALEKVSFDLNANCPDSNYKNSNLVITNINAAVAHNYLKGIMKFSGADDFPMDINLDGQLNLADIKLFYPIDSLDMKGKVAMKIETKGKYNKAKNYFLLQMPTSKWKTVLLRQNITQIRLRKLMLMQL